MLAPATVGGDSRVTRAPALNPGVTEVFQRRRPHSFTRGAAIYEPLPDRSSSPFTAGCWDWLSSGQTTPLRLEGETLRQAITRRSVGYPVSTRYHSPVLVALGAFSLYCWTKSTIGMTAGGCASSMPSSSMTGPR